MQPLLRSAKSLLLGGDLVVSRIGFGATRVLGESAFGPPSDISAAKAVLRSAVEYGANLIDTADSYGPEISERLIADALYPYPSHLVLATKGGLRRDAEGGWHAAGRPEQLRRACEGSLRRLRVDRIDLYQLHDVDPSVPLEESLGALTELRAEGLIRHIGISNVDVRQVRRARRAAPIVSVQDRYSAVERQAEGVLRLCEEHGLVFLAALPLAESKLAGPTSPLARVAREHKVSPAQAALVWLLMRSPVVLPIPGSGTLQEVAENMAALTMI